MASDTSLVFNLVARDQATGELSEMGQKWATAGATIGAGLAMALGAGIVQNLDMGAANTKLAAQLGAGPAEAAELAKVSANVYSNAWGESTAEVNLAIKGVYQNIGDTSEAEGGLEGVTTKALALASTFDQDLTMATAAVGQLVRTGLARDADAAFDILTVGLGTAADKAGDLLETVNEYSTQFRRVGLDGQTAIGLISQGLKAGARDADQVADAIGIFGETALAGGTAVDDAFKSIGLSSGKMAKMIGQGGDSAERALETTMDALRGTKDEQVALNAAGTLFGDPGKVMAKSLFALDPATAAASAGLNKTAGETDKLVEKLADDPAHKLEELKRRVMLKLGEAGGGFIGFATRNQAVLKPLAMILGVVAGVVLTVAAAQKVYATYTALATAAETVRNSALWKSVAGYIRLNAVGLAAMARLAAASVASAATTAAAWAGSALASVGTWIAAVVRAAVTSAAQFVMMAARAVVWAATMAAQWVIAMGPVGWVIAAIVGLVVLIVANWDRIKAWTAAAWGWVWGKIKAVAIGIKAAVVALAVAVVNGWIRLNARVRSAVASAWNWVRNKISSVMTGARNAVTGAISRIGNAFVSLHVRARNALAGAGRWLLGAGRSVVTGLWNGIKSMGGWIAGKVKSWARTVIPGPIASALGIASPSRVTAAQGRWIARGLVQGLTGSGRQVRAAATKLADIIRDSLAPSRRRSRVLSLIGRGSGQLAVLARNEERLAARMKAATRRIADQIKARDKLAADVRKGVLDSAGITQGADAGPVTADTILARLTEKMGQARAFAAQLATLRKKGVRSDLIAQVAQDGVEQGSGAAAALAMASKGQLAQINRTQGALVGAAARAGAVAGDAMYGAGIQSARGLVRGLRSQEKAIERQMLKIAAGMQRAIKRALGIRSPSTVMADRVGRWIPAGIAQGIGQRQGLAVTAMREMARTTQDAAPGARPAGPQPGGLLARGPGVAGVVRVQIDLTGADADLKQRIQRMVRIDGRGSVQTAFGRSATG